MALILSRLLIISAIYQILAVYFSSSILCSAANKVSAIFVFGDSMVEAGNNYYINTFAKPTCPNGIDFVKEEELGFKDYSPPYLAPNTTGDVILKGVNYASSGSGILNATGRIFGEHICMDTQVSYFAKTRQDIISRIGKPKAHRLLRKALYFLMIGPNDVIFHQSSETKDTTKYFKDIVSRFKSQLTTLYKLGARKIVVTNIPPVGCTPFARDTEDSSAGECVSSLNDLAKLYNSRLMRLLKELEIKLPGSIFVTVNSYAILEDILNNYRLYGFEIADSACCRVIGKHGGKIPCIQVIIISAIYQILVTILFSPSIFCSASKKVPAIFVFGDSLAEVGNNFYIQSFAKPSCPNGEELGFKNYTPPYLNPKTTGDVILKGVNYASSGSGIFNSSGSLWGAHISMDEQIKYFANTRRDIICRIGAKAARKLLRRSLYIVATAANDLFVGMDLNQSSVEFDNNTYTSNMTSAFRFQLTSLYNLDARKIAVANVPPIGCTPNLRDRFSTDDCVEGVNEFVNLYNTKLKKMLPKLTTNLSGSKFVYMDAYASIMEILQNYKSYGFTNGDSACCQVLLGQGKHGGLFPCVFFAVACPDRKTHVFWDAYHATEPVNLIAAKRLMDGGLEYVSPINIRKLAYS
ncbi:Lipase, GDSL [Corchorus olitorius]|uniref:Lipase, GDSL n=1 Tax=Corchorus olitorius TaxID=93759 RepID=A0A1R3H6F8_9ROSI|nr:Lipase, GDSL [Corchorus olitorius]